MGRTDDVINVAGHRLSTGEMEEIVAAHPAVAECAVIGVQDQLKGQMPIGLVILKDGADIDPETLQKELVANVRANIGAIACFQTAHVVNRLPKTRSGKILRAFCVRSLTDRIMLCRQRLKTWEPWTTLRPCSGSRLKPTA